MPLTLHHGLDLPTDRTAGPRRGRPSNPPGTGTPPPTIETEVPHPIVTDRIAHAAAEVSLTKVQGKRAWKWGKQRIEGKIQYVFRQATNDIWMAIELCKGECDSLLNVNINNSGWQAVSSNTISGTGFAIWWYAGVSGGTVDTHLAAVDGTWNEAFAGTCYAIVHLWDLDKNWPQRPTILFEQKCYKPIDPRTDARAYSENPFVQWYDWQLDAEGRKSPAARILKQSWKDAADIADQAVGGRKRYESHMSLDDGIDLDDVDKAFRLMTDSYLFRENGQLKVVCDRPGSSVATYGDSNLSTAYNPRMSREDGLEKPNRVWIEFTDITNDWKPKPVKAETAAVTAGTEDEIPVTYKMPWIHDEGLAISRATFILNSYLYDAKLVVPWNETASDRLLGDIVTQGVLARGLSYVGRLISKTKQTGKSVYDAVLLEYNAARYLDDTSSSPAKTPSTLPGPGDVPPNVDTGTVTVTEEPYRAQDDSYPTRARIVFTNPTFYFLDCVELWVSIAGGEYRYYSDCAGGSGANVIVFYDSVNEHGVTYTFKFISRSRFGPKSAGSTVAALLNGVSGGVPEIVDENVSLTYSYPLISSTLSALYYGAPQSLSTTRYTTGFWISVGLLNYDGTKVNDAILNVKAFDYAAGPTYLKFDAGVGNTKAFRRLGAWTTAVSQPFLTIEYSDNDSSWTAVVQQSAKDKVDAGGGVTEYTWAWTTAAGAHRYWRIGGNAAIQINEVQLSEFTGAYLYVREYRLYDMRNSQKQLYDTIPASGIPTSAKTFNIDPIVSKSPANGVPNWVAGYSGNKSCDILLTTVSTGGVESVGLRMVFAGSFSPSGNPVDPKVVQSESSVTLANGLNSNIALPAGPGSIIVSGPTGAFTLGGFSSNTGAPTGGEVLFVDYDGAQACTIKQEDASSTAALRIRTLTGADIVLAAGKFQLVFIYWASVSRWVLLSARDSTGTVGPMLGAWLTGTLPANYAAAADPPAGDSTQKVATTNFVQGEGMQKVTSLSPSTNTGINGTVQGGTTIPRGIVLTQGSTSSTTDQTIVNISSGKGVLRFLSVGQSGTGAPVLTVIVDGVTVINAIQFDVVNNAGSGNPALFNAIIGAIISAWDGTSTQYSASAVPSESGITFKSSLVIKLHSTVSGQVSNVAYAYALY